MGNFQWPTTIFYIQGEQYGIDLAVEISQGLREKPISGTPEDYIKIYTGNYYLLD